MKVTVGPYFELKKFKKLNKSDYWELSAKNAVSCDTDGNYSFSKAGVFSAGESLYLVLPWILSETTEIDASSVLAEGMSRFNWFKQLTCSDVTERANISSGTEFIIASMYFGMKDLIESGMRYNVFREETVNLGVIKGKWHVERDLVSGHAPVRFTCTVDECDSRHPILGVALSFCQELLEIVTSDELRHSVEDLFRRLSTLVSIPDDFAATLEQAVKLAKKDRRFADWVPWLEGVENLTKDTGSSASLGNLAVMEDFEFQTADFFEDAVQLILEQCKFKTNTQESGKILGGSFWVADASGKEGKEETFDALSVKNARQTSRPDILISRDDGEKLLVECKYKQFRPGLTGSGKQGQGLKIHGLQRDDRNQLLSFILSSSEKFSFRSTSLVVVYPISDEDEYSDRIPALRFNAQQTSKPGETFLRWGQPVKDQQITVYFIGIRVHPALAAISKKDEKNPELVRIKSALLNVSGWK